MISAGVLEIIKEFSLFQGIKEETLRNFSSLAIEKEYKKGNIVFLDKEKVEYIYITVSGKFSLYKTGEDGHKKVIYILEKGKIINDVILDDLPASINCEVFEDGKVVAISKKKFLNLMEADFNLTKSVINSLSIKVRRLYRQLKNTSTSTRMDKKLAAKLWKLSKDYGIETKEGILINLNLSMTYLATMFGSQRETISRGIRDLEKEHLIIVINKKIIIKNREKLAEFFKKP